MSMTRSELRQRFRAERALFAREYPSVARVTLHFSSRMHNPWGYRERDVAWCNLQTRRVYLVERALDLSRDNLVGLIRHELGHLADPTPEAFRCEHRADRIAQKVTGRAIRYDKRAIQTVGPGGPRPKWLPW